MTAFFTASVARHAQQLLPGLLVASAAGQSWKTTETMTNCESTSKSAVNIKKRLTTIGRLALDSETPANPSVPTFFISLVGSRSLTKDDFCHIWRAKGIGDRHARFHQTVESGHFVPSLKPVEEHISEGLFPAIPRLDLAYRVAKYLTNPMDLTKSLWHLDLLSGPLGRSGAISKRRTSQLIDATPDAIETLLLFRSHHAMADGVSLVAAVTELCDEWEDLQAQIKAELKKRRSMTKSLLQKITTWLRKFFWFWTGSMQAWLYQLRLIWNTPNHPFAIVKQKSPPSTGRNVSWCEVTTVDEVKSIASAFGKNVTVNDIWVSCATYAVAQQLQEHKKTFGLTDADHTTINVVIPVHLQGGILLPGQSLGNRIGAFTASVPGEDSTMTAGKRLEQTHQSLHTIKQTPAALLSYLSAHVLGSLPTLWTTPIFRRATANACIAVTNVRNASHKLHIQGMAVETVTGFLPLAPGIPIGVVVQSYAGNMQLSVTAETYAVPDANIFLAWMVEEYQRLLIEAEHMQAKSELKH